MLNLSDNETELMLMTSKRTKHLHNSPTSITISNAQISFKQSLKNLCFTLDCLLPVNEHVFTNARKSCFLLGHLA